MATPPSVSPLAVTRDGYSGCLPLIGVQPQRFEDSGDGLRPVVKQRVEPAVGITAGYLAAG